MPLRQVAGQETQYNYVARARCLRRSLSYSRELVQHSEGLCSISLFVSGDFEVLLVTELQHLPFPL